jgi:homocysteine S-methyltransferase
MGAVGPLGQQLAPLGTLSCDEAKSAFSEQIRGLLAGGVDGLVFETFSNLDEMTLALQVARDEAGAAFMVASMTIQEDGCTVYGVEPERFAPHLHARGADVVGINCSVGPAAMLPVVERMRASTAGWICVQPNAGVPRNVEGRNLYLCSPEYLSEYARRFVQRGANLLGGCCGTTPRHIRSMRSAIRAMVADRSRPAVSSVESERTAAPTDVAAPPLAERSTFGRALADRAFPISVELTPPRGHVLAKLLEKARALRTLGITCVNLPDGPRATARMSALATGVRLQAEAGIEIILHYTCRDRNVLGIQSDLLGAYALGIRNLLLITGDPPKMGTYPDATGVFDVDAIGLTHLVHRLNSGIDLGNTAIGAPTAFVFGVGLNPGALSLELEIERYRRKLDAGAEYAITQPVFDLVALRAFFERLEQLGLRRVPILAGVWPLSSLANAQFLNSEVPGVSVPDAVLARMAAAPDRASAQAVGVEIAREMVLAARPMVEGLQLSAPAGMVELLENVLEP